MQQLTYVALLERSVADLMTGVTDLDIVPMSGGGAVLYATSRSGEAISIFSVGPDGSVSFLDHQTLTDNAECIELMEIAGLECVVALGVQGAMPRLYQISANGEVIGSPTTLGTAADGLDILARSEIGGETYLYGADSGAGQGLQAFRVRPNGTLETLDAPSLAGGVSRVAEAEAGGARFILAVSGDGTALSSLEQRGDGSLRLRGTIGAADGLGVAGISALSQADLPDGSYVIVAARGSSSLSVIELRADGTLLARDHILDDLNTRFQHVTALETVTVGDRAFVVVGGGDDGVSLFELLPGGRLLHLSTMSDDFGTTLENVASLTAAVVDGDLHVFVGSATETGVTQLTYDLGTHGATQIGSAGSNTINGSMVGDVLSGGAGDDWLHGRMGRDILLDGAGQDTLYGGAGADIFVLEADGDQDRIMDFDPSADRIDLSAWPMLRDIGQLTFIQTSYGARLTFGQEDLRIYSVYGTPFSAAEILQPWLINLSRVPTGDPDVQKKFYGTAGNDNLAGNWANNLMIGRAGDDTLSGSSGNDTLKTGSGDDVIRGEEGNDLIRGQLHDDKLLGGSGHDTLVGGAGHDLLVGHWGKDNLRGGDGRDRLEGGRSNDRLTGGSASDEFVFTTKSGRDLVVDFTSGVDELHLDDALWNGALTAQQVVDEFARTKNGRTFLDFDDGTRIILKRFDDLDSLVDDIVIF